MKACIGLWSDGLFTIVAKRPRQERAARLVPPDAGTAAFLALTIHGGNR